jgi:hypothetical protein
MIGTITTMQPNTQPNPQKFPTMSVGDSRWHTRLLRWYCESPSSSLSRLRACCLQESLHLVIYPFLTCHVSLLACSLALSPLVSQEDKPRSCLSSCRMERQSSCKNILPTLTSLESSQCIHKYMLDAKSKPRIREEHIYSSHHGERSSVSDID